jgi:hypothetical protein
MFNDGSYRWLSPVALTGGPNAAVRALYWIVAHCSTSQRVLRGQQRGGWLNVYEQV